MGLPGNGLGQQQGSIPTWGVLLAPFSPVFSPLPALSPLPRAKPAFPGACPRLPPVCLLAEPVAVLPAREALLSPGSPSQAPDHTVEQTQGHLSGAPEHPAPNPGAGDPLVASHPCTVEEQCSQPRTVAG